MEFGEVRKAALSSWKASTGRKRKGKSDNIGYTWECLWQNHFLDKYPDEHYSIFCSIGEWNSNITDCLKDSRYDKLSFNDEKSAEILFRYYTRILLIISEALTDFQDIIGIFENERFLKNDELKTIQKNIRKYLSHLNDSDNEIQEVFTFINSICKHKANNFHFCNHHVKIFFEDNIEKKKLTKDTITIKNINNFIKGKKVATNIVMPKLSYFINQITNGYELLHHLFISDETKFLTFCKLYLPTN